MLILIISTRVLLVFKHDNNKDCLLLRTNHKIQQAIINNSTIPKKIKSPPGLAWNTMHVATYQPPCPFLSPKNPVPIPTHLLPSNLNSITIFISKFIYNGETCNFPGVPRLQPPPFTQPLGIHKRRPLRLRRRPPPRRLCSSVLIPRREVWPCHPFDRDHHCCISERS